MNSNNLRVFALGGLHEIGKNCYILEKNDEIIIIDCGIKFLSESNLADGAIPNFEYLRENRSKIKGLFITHGHEDHIGGIPYLLDLIPTIPIYGSNFSISLLKQKVDNKGREKMIIFDDKSIINTGEFQICFFRVTHSIPGSFGLIVSVLKENVRVAVTGDFKFDWNEIGEKFDILKLASYGEKGIDLLLSDSTNSEIEGYTLSESKVIKRLENIIKESSGRVIITSFASNVYRLSKVIEIAKKTKKKIVLLGSSLMKMMKVINKAKLWEMDSSIFLKSSLINKTQRKDLIIFCTGSQGEEKAVLSRLANQNYPEWKISRGDSVILTSSPIMDNKFNVEAINNLLFSLGAKIYENSKEDFLHASGHGCQEDLKLMLKLTDPKHFMPFHGEYRMLKNHGKLAKDLGIKEKKIFICDNGDVLECKDKEFFLTEEKINVKPNYILNRKLLPSEEIEKNENLRKIMAKGGVILVIIFYDERKKAIKDYPYIFTHGFTNMKKNELFFKRLKTEINDFSQNNLFKNNFEDELKDYIEKFLSRSHWIKNMPLIKTIFIEE